MVKKILIRVVVLLLVFFAAVFAIGKYINRDTPDTTQEMSRASFPLVYMMEGDMQINSLHGHASQMDVTAMRDALTPVDSDRTLTIQIQPFQKKISGVSFEVLTSDGRKSMEKTKVTNENRCYCGKPGHLLLYAHHSGGWAECRILYQFCHGILSELFERE